MQDTGADVVARALAARGIDTVYMVSGNQVLPLIDALGRLGLRMIHMRHETAAVYAAIGVAEMTGRASAALVSAGPGFLAALQGLGVAASMELPVLLLSGSPGTTAPDGAFQALDQEQIAGALCRASLTPGRVDRLEGTIHDAVNRAMGGPGPVHVRLPIDLLEAAVDPTGTPWMPDAESEERLDERLLEQLNAMADFLGRAERPAIIARPSIARGSLLVELAELVGVAPIVAESPRGVSDLKYAEMVAVLPNADCLLVIAPADFAVGFLRDEFVGRPGRVLLLDAPGDPVAERSPDLHARAGAEVALRYLTGRIERRTPVDAVWASGMAVAVPPKVSDVAGELMHPLAVAAAIREVLTPDDVIVLDGGEFCQWVRLGLRDVANPVLWNGKLGAIGGGIPMALGVAATRSMGRVIVVLGDGSAGYHLSEFETAARYGLPVVAVIGNDARWAAEWHMQVGRYGAERAFATELSYARYEVAAEGFGGVGYAADDVDGLRDALRLALESGRPACVNVRVASVRSPAVVH